MRKGRDAPRRSPSESPVSAGRHRGGRHRESRPPSRAAATLERDPRPRHGSPVAGEAKRRRPSPTSHGSAERSLRRHPPPPPPPPPPLLVLVVVVVLLLLLLLLLLLQLMFLLLLLLLLQLMCLLLLLFPQLLFFECFLFSLLLL